MPAPALIEDIVTQDINSLVTIPGIGKKTAERMVLELKDKLFDESAPSVVSGDAGKRGKREEAVSALEALDRKSTRLNSSHVAISYAVFCLKKKRRGTDTQIE